MMEKSIWQKIGDAVATWAPGIGATLTATGAGAPVGIALTAVGALVRSFGLGDDAKPEEILAAVTGDPEAKLKVLQASQDFELKKRDQDISELKALLEDTQNARQRQSEHEKATGKTDTNLYVLAWVLVVGFFVLLGTLMAVPVPEDQNGVIFMLFGALSTGFGQVLQYFFGSSKGSQEKNLQISKMRQSFAGR